MVLKAFSQKFHISLVGNGLGKSIRKKKVKTWASRLILPGDPLFPSKKLSRFQVCGGEGTETKAPPRQGRDLFFEMLVFQENMCSEFLYWYINYWCAHFHCYVSLLRVSFKRTITCKPDIWYPTSSCRCAPLEPTPQRQNAARLCPWFVVNPIMDHSTSRNHDWSSWVIRNIISNRGMHGTQH